MKGRGLKTQIFLSFVAVIIFLVLCIAVFRSYVIRTEIVARAQRQVKNDLKAARSIYSGELERIEKMFGLASASGQAPGALKKMMGLDYMYRVSAGDAGSVKSDIARKAFDGNAIGGTRIIGADELKEMGEDIRRKAEIDVVFTEKARPSDVKVLRSAMAMEYAVPLFDTAGAVTGLMFGGRILNRDFSLVDDMRDMVFENRLYGGKPVGTVTIFQDDIRIATNVLDKKGERAIGTRVSDTVYDTVLNRGLPWRDRAFVVTDWYLTAYEPIRDINGDVIGMLYVGTLERPFKDLERASIFGVAAIAGLAALLAAALSYLLAVAIVRPVTELMRATSKISEGEMGHRVAIDSHIKELNVLAASFNEMAASLHERDTRVNVSNEKLATLNKRYLDLIGFVAHELKGILASTILNAYAVRDGFLGMINFKQRKALDSVARHLDYLEATVKNFLDLSRIEKGEMAVNKKEVLLKEDVFDMAQEAFSKPASEKHMEISSALSPALKVMGDTDLLRIVANNLLGNAVKYGIEKGKIAVTGRSAGDRVEVEVYNDGRPLTAEETERLFQRFSRVQAKEQRKTQGTGLGLFITKEIVEKHRGAIRVEPRQSGNAFIFTLEKGGQDGVTA